MESLRSKAKEYLRQQDWERAETCYTLLIERNPQEIDLYMQRQGVFFQQRRYDQAIQDLETILDVTEEERDSPRIFYRAEAFALRASYLTYIFSDYEEALQSSNRALELFQKLVEENPTEYAGNLINQYYRHGDILREVGELKQAKRVLSIGLEFCIALLKHDLPKNVKNRLENKKREGLMQRGEINEDLQKWRSAIEDYKELGDYLGEYCIGKLFFSKGKIASAKRYLLLALSRGIEQEEEYTDILEMLYVLSNFAKKKEEQEN